VHTHGFVSYAGNAVQHGLSVSNDGMRFLAFLTAVVVCLAGECSPKVAPTTLRELTTSSDLIVAGEVTRVSSVKGLRVAEVRVTTTMKGQSSSTIYYLAQPTWICDTTSAIVGEETLFFFTKYRFDPHPASMAYVKPTGDPGTYAIENDVSPLGAFKEPTGFREQINALVGDSHFWQVSWAGRGQMPIRDLRGTKYATLWVGDVRLSESIHTVSGPEPEYSSFIRSAPLAAILAFVQQQSKAIVPRRKVQGGLR
jgi:hypothetical protein